MNETNNSAYLSKLNIKSLNDMQEAAIKTAAEKNDIILLSATGSGKTLAFLLPMLATLKEDIKLVQALILVPSRELALQIESVLKQMQTGYKVLSCYGGHKREIEENSLVEPPAIIIATAGRMADHIRRNNVDLKEIQYLILDEFDKSLELGFLEEMKFIIESLPAVKKRMLTSATFAESIPDFVKMNEPEMLNFLPEEAVSSEILRIKTVLSPDKDKLETLLQLICYANNTSTIVFCNHREAVERVSNFLSDQGLVNVFYHGGMEQRDREVALTKFRNTSSNILITTDLASRGLDIADIRNIVHYHLPLEEASFTHRNGRTARMGTTGNVYVIHSEDEKMPAYLTENAEEFVMPDRLPIPEKPKWSTLFIDAGKKDKINKIDIVGFLSQKGMLKKDEIGLIEVKDFMAFAAVRKSKVGNVLELIKNEKLKGKKIKIAVAK
ncbi:DEAD/DEAH box helicase [Ferruginibacter sp. HRS2-29]|uniref:DEAD/DEAH box helicase n=1 Tax=Ferruginibacter sp. HRS2-29 TaxID=2487334 RepID=UPI0020CC5D15|nr:DEAD/DEAH box helicase [Ferruginibacter sp. HRS2-29]MCP9752057.1 DEAD/DEAH box helicase [Ferruginibacter sp. HRS2-29]